MPVKFDPPADIPHDEEFEWVNQWAGAATPEQPAPAAAPLEPPTDAEASAGLAEQQPVPTESLFVFDGRDHSFVANLESEFETPEEQAREGEKHDRTGEGQVVPADEVASPQRPAEISDAQAMPEAEREAAPPAQEPPVLKTEPMPAIDPSAEAQSLPPEVAPALDEPTHAAQRPGRSLAGFYMSSRGGVLKQWKKIWRGSERDGLVADMAEEPKGQEPSPPALPVAADETQPLPGEPTVGVAPAPAAEIASEAVGLQPETVPAEATTVPPEVETASPEGETASPEAETASPEAETPSPEVETDSEVATISPDVETVSLEMETVSPAVETVAAEPTVETPADEAQEQGPPSPAEKPSEPPEAEAPPAPATDHVGMPAATSGEALVEVKPQDAPAIAPDQLERDIAEIMEVRDALSAETPVSLALDRARKSVRLVWARVFR
jgi:hypothetical protein